MKLPEGLKSAISSKVLGKTKDIASKVTGGHSEDATLKVIAKNFMSIPSMARDLNVAKQNVTKLVKLEGGKPATGADMWFKKSKQNEENLEAQLKKHDEKSKDDTTKKASPVKSAGSSKFSKLASLLKVGAVILALSQIPGGFIKNIFDGIVDSITDLASSIWSEITTAFDSFVSSIKKWFGEVIQPILDELKIFLEKVWAKITEFFKPIFDWVGDKIKSIVEYLQPVFDFMKGVLDKVFAVVNVLKDKLSFLTDSISKAKKSLENASGPSSDVQYDEMGNVISDSGAEAAGAMDAKKKREEAIAKQKRESTTGTSEAGMANYKGRGAAPAPTTQGDSGRGNQGGPSAAEMAKKDLTPSQLKWLGGADPTDPYIMARMPPPQPGEKGGPVIPPAPPAPAPAAPTAPPPVPAGPPAGVPAPPTAVPTVKPVSPSDTKPEKISSQQGESIMIKSMDDAKITDPTARAAIMAQVGHESGNFTTLSENLNYKAPTLMKLFPKKFNGEEDAKQVAAGGPQKVAERLYAGRMGNAPEGSGEGFKYRGRGFVQLTGKANYTKFGFGSNPDAVSQPAGAAETAIKYMMGYKGDWSDITKVTKFVNGGTIGLEDRMKHFQAYLNDPKITKVGAASTAASGGAVSSASTQVAADQRQQQKPNTPIVVNAPTTNNTNVVKNETKTTATSQANQTLLARAT